MSLPDWPALPNFFIAGAPKTGTTSLYSYLNQHPAVYMSRVKEPCYFASEMRSQNFEPEFQESMDRSSRNLLRYIDGPMSGANPGGVIAEWKDYLKLFKNVTTETAIGEASVCYLWSSTAALQIQSKIPTARIVMILRNPAERAFSQYLQYAAGGLVRRPFREHVNHCMRDGRSKFGLFCPFLEYGLYYEQVKRYLCSFPRASIRIYLYEEAWRCPGQLLADVFEFLGVDPGFEVNTSTRILERQSPKWLAGFRLLKRSGFDRTMKALIPRLLRERVRGMAFHQGKALRLEAKDREYLRDYYKEDIQKLSGLLDRDLTGWLRCGA